MVHNRLRYIDTLFGDYTSYCFVKSVYEYTYLYEFDNLLMKDISIWARISELRYRRIAVVYKHDVIITCISCIKDISDYINLFKQSSRYEFLMESENGITTKI